MISSPAPGKAPNRRLRMLLALPAAAAAAAVVTACGSSGTPSAASPAAGAASSAHAAAAAGLKTAKIGSATVLASARGFTLYSFAPDTSTTSKCNGACAQNWPPVKPATASAVKGTFGTIKRSDGSAQLTFHGHPLYTFAGDKSPGQANGNGINAFGGLWHEITLSGAAAPAAASSSGGGFGY